MDLAAKRVVVVGLGRSGVAAARLCLARGATVVLNDATPLERWSDDARQLVAEGALAASGHHEATVFDGADLVVISPGVPPPPAVLAFEATGREVIGEMELASRFVHAPIALIGGTNGKSTTTALLHAMLVADGKKAFIGGNFGQPLAEVVDEPWDALVLEISSFQAERVPTLHAKVHALLNITDDHLDRYASFADYAHAKGNPFARMGAADVAVIPANDALCEAEARRGHARRVTFSSEGPADVAVVGDALVDGMTGRRYPIASLRIAGRHNLANACAAIACANALGASESAISEALATFTGLGHRTALVAEVNGVRYYDDSKGTNVGASVAALRGLAEARAVLIAGGRDKLGAYEPLVEALRERGRALVVLGEAAPRIAAAARGVLAVASVTSMVEAVRVAARFAEAGDAVLLSPACSSFDMFRDYKHRGDVFVAEVLALRARASEGGGA